MTDANGETSARDVLRERSAALRALAERKHIGDAREASPELRQALRVFGSEQDLLLAAHHRWQVNLLARLDQVLELGSDDPHRDVLEAVAELSRTLPGVAALLSDHAGDPALAAAWRRLAGYVGQACPRGRWHTSSPGRPRRTPRRRAW